MPILFPQNHRYLHKSFPLSGYQSFLPCLQLRPYIKCFAIAENVAEHTYKVLPDTGLVLGFQYSGRLSHIQPHAETPLSVWGITGLQDGYRVFKNTAATGSVLVYFKEAGAAHFFSQPMHELFRQSLSLDNLVLRSELLLLEEQLCEAKTDIQRIKAMEHFLLLRFRPHTLDAMVLAAISHIHATNGSIAIKELAALLHTSPSPLEKRFRKVVGASPKKFASIVRMRHAINSISQYRSLTSLAYDAGFYDQSHFIKEFKSYTGDTPEAFLHRL